MKSNSIETELISGARLADLLGVSAPAVSKAVRQGGTCKGIGIREFAVFDTNGTVKGYRAKEILKVLSRKNPKEQTSDSTSPKAGKKGSSSSPNITFEPGAIRLFDDAKPLADAAVLSTGIAKAPEILNAIQNLDEAQQKTFMTIISAVVAGIFGTYIAPEDQKTTYGIVGGLIGAGLYKMHEYLETQRKAAEETKLPGWKQNDNGIFEWKPSKENTSKSPVIVKSIP